MGSMNTIVRGDNTPQLQKIVYDFDPQRGWNVISSYDGASQLYMEQLAQQCAAANIACRLTYQFDKATLETNDATQLYTLDTWQILGNDICKDIFSHPTVLSICNNDQIAFIRYSINNLDTSKPASGAIAGILSDPSFPAPTLSGSAQATMTDFIGLYLKGTTDFRMQQYVLRHTTNVPNSWPANASGSWPASIAASNVNCIYTTAHLLTETKNIGSWILPLPPEMQYFLQQIPALGPASGYLFGWLKGASTTTTAANNRVDISTEYVCELWSTDLYQPAQ